MASERLLATSPVATVLGLTAILLWGTTIAFSRGMAERLGTFTGAALAYVIAGSVGCVVLAVQGRLISVLRAADRRYFWGCGALMLLYTVLLYSAVGLAENRAQVIAVTVANYLWPSLTLLFSVPILGWSANRGLLGIGSAVAVAGVALTLGVDSSLPEATVSTRSLLAVGSAIAAAVAWGLYSTLGRRWADSDSTGAMPCFLLVTGFALLALCIAMQEQSSWNLRGIIEALYVAIFPTLLAYTFWDFAVRRGNLRLVAPASYLTPLFSVGISSLYLGISLQPQQWLAGVLVVAGAIICRQAVRD